MTIAVRLFIIVFLVGLGVMGFVYSGLYNVGASSPHGGFTNWLLATTSHASVKRRAGDIIVPNLDDQKLVLAGINDFDSMCSDCHGAPGKEPAAVGQGLNPSAPDLAEEAAELTPAELFWVTKHGIKMTGMPAWGATHDDDALWPVVAFMTRLPDLDEDGYLAMLGRAEGLGHHQDGDGHGDHEHGSSDAESVGASDSHEHGETAPEASSHDDTPDEAAHDHSTHSHDKPTPITEEVPQGDDAALRDIIEAIRVGWLEADAAPFRKHFLDFEGARYFEGGGQNAGLTDLIEHHVEPEADAFESFSLNFSNIETHIENGFAWALVDTEIKAVLKHDGRVIDNKGRGTYLFRMVDGEWKVVHTNSASRPVKKEEHKH